MKSFLAWQLLVGSLYFLSPVTAAASVATSLNDFSYDENNRLSKHILVYSSGRCADLVEGHFQSRNWEPYGYDLFALEGDARRAYFGGEGGGFIKSPPKSVDDCNAMCVERGVDQSLVTSVMPFRKFDGTVPFSEWFDESCIKTEVCFMNYWNQNAPITMYWVHPRTGRRQVHHSLGYAERNTFCCDSFLGHKFQFEDSETKEILLDYTVEYTCMVSIGETPPYTVGDKNYTKEIQETLDREWDRRQRVTYTFTEHGFKKGRLPDDIFASMGAFHYNNFENRVREEWSGKGVFVNWWEVDVYFIQLPWKLKGIWQDRLRELVEYWVGLELEQTDMYGMRRYETGARLLTHVDREATHAASLIVNVAQGNIGEPWPVEIHDHADRLHLVNMEPGDIVYYESAKCLHGRNTPLKGEGAYYTNLFTHYRPIGDPEWFLKKKMPHMPDPLIDIGQCKVEEPTKKVTCDNPAIGPYLAPTLFTAHSGADLFDYWLSVGESTESSSTDKEL